ncbi:MAG: zf-HC2 domain-containing protein [Nitrosomonas sp.]|nr:zf-HC2 domain-containing protein [Nitrosomonas sp.]
MLNCNKASLLASRALDEKLPFGSKFMLNLHLMLCRSCKNFAKQLAFLQAAAHHTRINEHLKLSKKAKQRISNAIKAK